MKKRREKPQIVDDDVRTKVKTNKDKSHSNSLDQANSFAPRVKTMIKFWQINLLNFSVNCALLDAISFCWKGNKSTKSKVMVENVNKYGKNVNKRLKNVIKQLNNVNKQLKNVN